MKYLLKQKGDRGLFLFIGNNCPFVVATIEDNNGIGQPVNSWWQGKYFMTLDEALESLNR